MSRRVAVGVVIWALFVVGSAARARVVDKIRHTGADENRLVVVLVGDGYTASEEGKFHTDAQGVVDDLLVQSPWVEYASYVNVYTDFVASVQSGADKPAPCYRQEVFRNTAFDSTYCMFGTQRLLAADPVKVFQEINAAVPQWDVVGVIVNDPEYGGSGGSILTLSTDAAASEIFLHEMGHTFGGLADEYTASNGGTRRDPEPNVDLDYLFDDVKWNVWIDPSTPLPTPTSVDTIGAYEGARYFSTDIYRPVLDCKMRSLDRPFGAVCKEGHIQALYTFVDPIDVSVPSADTIDVPPCDTWTFRIIPQQPDPFTLEIVWELDGVPIPGETGFELQLPTSSLTENSTVLRARVTDRTDMVRRTYWSPMEGTNAWVLRRTVPWGDLDGDQTEDACDPDIDGDAVDNDFDCAPRAPQVWEEVPEVPVLLVGRTPIGETRLDWNDVLGPAGSPEEGDYALISGVLADLAADAGYDRACRIDAARDPLWTETRNLSAGARGFYYLVAGRNDCGFGPVGVSSASPDPRQGLDPASLPACR